MEIPDQLIVTLLIGLLLAVLAQAIMSYRAFYQHKEEVRNHLDTKSENIVKSIENWNIKNENCSIRIDNIYARLESFEGKQEQANKDIWTRTDQMERRLHDELSLLKKDILVLQTTSDLLRKVGLRGSEDTYQKRGGDE
ncbi:hypothetical protein [Methanoculleus sp.]|uniref:hypothetical protein n=1 Tax=Methanoculleus sp. TaxID=90427 RepID=UPI0025E9BD71|nr:hypothetical protein [Methanoculleus sp.]